MNTQAISGPANILTPAPAQGNSAALSNTADIPFNQVLQREVSERRNTDQPAQSESHQSEEKSPRQDSAAQATTGTGKTDAASKSKDEAEATDGAEQLSDAGNATAELIALVTSIAQILPPAVDAKPTASGAEGDVTKLQLNDGSRTTDKMLNAGEDVIQTAKDASKASINAVPSQQFSTTQTVALQNGAIPLDYLVAQQESSAPEAGTTSAMLPTMSMQTQTLNKVQAATTLAADSVAPPVGTPAWDQAVGR